MTLLPVPEEYADPALLTSDATAYKWLAIDCIFRDFNDTQSGSCDARFIINGGPGLPEVVAEIIASAPFGSPSGSSGIWNLSYAAEAYAFPHERYVVNRSTHLVGEAAFSFNGSYYDYRRTLYLAARRIYRHGMILEPITVLAEVKWPGGNNGSPVLMAYRARWAPSTGGATTSTPIAWTGKSVAFAGSDWTTYSSLITIQIPASLTPVAV
jgi:hypothetical protein